MVAPHFAERRKDSFATVGPDMCRIIAKPSVEMESVFMKRVMMATL
jgi:hypothetical protein